MTLTKKPTDQEIETYGLGLLEKQKMAFPHRVRTGLNIRMRKIVCSELCEVGRWQMISVVLPISKEIVYAFAFKKDKEKFLEWYEKEKSRLAKV